MVPSPFDFRSDTVTRPTAAMRHAMATAEVGDDVFGDDPTVLRLQRRVASMLGKQAALFVPSGTMANQIALRCWTEAGNEFICEEGSHIYLYEGGGYAALAGLSVRTLVGDRGRLSPEAVRRAIRPLRSLSHFPYTRLICIENTANRGGGTLYELDRIEAIGAVAREASIPLHLDGARLWNASVVLGQPLATLAGPCDSVSLCFSKGLGCPVGSILVGPQTFIDRAHRVRKMLGGGMRQAGVLAAAALHALDHHIDRLREDHVRARALSTALATVPGLQVDPELHPTNMIYIGVEGTGLDALAFVEALAARSVWVSATDSHTVRAVCHLDIDDAAVAHAIEAMTAVARGA